MNNVTTNWVHFGGLVFTHMLVATMAAGDTGSLAQGNETNTFSPSSGLVSWWPGDGEALDAADHNDGILRNEANFAPGIVGQAFSLHGGAYVEIPDAPNLNYWGTNSMSVALWAFRTGQDPTMHLISKRFREMDMEYQIANDPSRGLHFGNAYANNPNVVNSYIQFPANVWWHLAATSDGQMLKFYINGKLVAANPGHLGPPNSAPLRIGTIDYVVPYPFEGLIDEVLIYNRALSAEEIRFIYDSGEVSLSAPTIAEQPQGQTVYSGANVFFNVQANGTPPLFYQWQLNGTNLVNATNNTLLLTGVGSANSGLYTVIVHNSLDSVASKPASLRIVTAPRIVQQPVSLVGLWGQSATLKAVAVGTEPLTYQWYKSGLIIPEATNASITFAKLEPGDAGTYTVVVGDGWSTVSSNPAFVQVNPAGVSIGLYPGITIEGMAGQTYRIQYATNLNQTNAWTALTSITLTNNTQLWTDSEANAQDPTQPRRYYLVLPNP